MSSSCGSGGAASPSSTGAVSAGLLGAGVAVDDCPKLNAGFEVLANRFGAGVDEPKLILGAAAGVVDVVAPPNLIGVPCFQVWSSDALSEGLLKRLGAVLDSVGLLNKLGVPFPIDLPKMLDVEESAGLLNKLDVVEDSVGLLKRLDDCAGLLEPLAVGVDSAGLLKMLVELVPLDTNWKPADAFAASSIFDRLAACSSASRFSHSASFSSSES